MIPVTVYDLCKAENFAPVVCPAAEREITGVYIGDLLSWVMGKAQNGDGWITIMSNINTLAVASLTDVACIILAEGVTLEQEIIDAAIQKEINVVTTTLSAYETALFMSKELKDE